MSECIELAGFAAAQALCCLFDRIPVPPMAFSRKASGAATVTILPGGTASQIADSGRRWLDANDNRADDAVVVYDGYVTIAAIKKDALILDLRSYREPITARRMAVPYRPHHHPLGFAVHRPNFIVDAIEGHDTAALIGAFFRSVCTHDCGCRIWETCVDQSC
jgi:hypothetical protein